MGTFQKYCQTFVKCRISQTPIRVFKVRINHDNLIVVLKVIPHVLESNLFVVLIGEFQDLLINGYIRLVWIILFFHIRVIVLILQCHLLRNLACKKTSK